MVAAVAVIVWFLAAAVALVRPKWGVALIWPAMWLYPNTALYGTLPLNVRFDDLWIVFMFGLAIFYARGRGGSALLWLASVWVLSCILGDFMGFFVTGGIGWQGIVKSGLKSLYVPMTVYILTVFLEDERDVLNHLKALGLAGSAAGILGIAMVYLPGPLSAFLIPEARIIGFEIVTALEMVESHEIITRRAQGALGTFGLAMVMMTVTVTALCMLVYHPRQRVRVFFGFMAGICLVGLSYTAMRGAIAGLLAAVLWALVFTRRRGILLGISVLGAALLVVQGGLFQRVLLRVTGEVGARMAPLTEGFFRRFAIWQTFVENFSPIYLFTGMGMTSVLQVAKATAHNTYLGAFVYGGLLGVVIMILTIARAWGLGRWLRMCSDAFSQGLGVAVTMGLVAFMVFGISNEILQRPTSMQLFFALMVIAHKRLEQVREAAASPVADSLPLEGPPEYAVAP
jgi:hypothetical protein